MRKPLTFTILVLSLSVPSLALKKADYVPLQQEIAKYEEEGRWEECLQALFKYEQVTASDPDQNIYTHIGSCYYHLGDFDKAKEYFDKSIATAPNLWWSPFYLGTIESSRGNYKKAAAWFNYALGATDLKAESNVVMIKFTSLANDFSTYQAGGGIDKEALLEECEEMERLIVANPEACEMTFRGGGSSCSTNGAFMLAQIYEYRRLIDASPSVPLSEGANK